MQAEDLISGSTLNDLAGAGWGWLGLKDLLGKRAEKIRQLH